MAEPAKPVTPDQARSEIPASLAPIELGATGLKITGGMVREEFLRELQGSRAAKIYKEMSSNDSAVGAALFAIEMLCRQVKWRVDPGDESAEAEKDQEFVEQCMDDMEKPWSEVIAEILEFLRYGWCVPPSQVVTLADGASKPAAQIAVGDEVITARGRARKIKHVFTRRHTGEMMALKVRGYPYAIRMTPEHELPTLAGWKKAGDLALGDVLMRPRPALATGGDYESGWIVGLYLAEGHVDAGRDRVNFSLHREEGQEVKERIDAWLAEREPSKHHLAKNESYIIGRSGERANGCQVSASHPALRQLIRDWVGGADAGTKHLLRLPGDELFVRGVVEGWVYGDGYDGRATSGTLSAATVSRKLAEQMQFLAGALGLPSSMRARKGGGISQIRGRKIVSASHFYDVSLTPVATNLRWKRTVELEARVREMRAAGEPMQAIATACGLSYVTVSKWLHSDGPKQHGLQCPVFQQMIGHPVEEIVREPYDGEVYDFEVEEDHTFCAGPVAVSNCLHEIVYKVRRGQDPKPAPVVVDKPATAKAGSANAPRFIPSKHDDGKLGWRKMPTRAQETLLKWEYDKETLEPLGMHQIVSEVPNPNRFIPFTKALLFRTTTKRENPEGVSVLRTAYRPWFFRKRIEEVEAIGIDRGMNGFPIMRIPGRCMATGANAADAAVHDDAKKVIRNLRIDEQMGLVLPSEYDDKGNPQYDLQFIGVDARRSVETNQVIQRYKTEILQSVMADFIMLGHDKVGSFSLSSDKTALFATAIAAFLTVIKDQFNRIEIPRLFRLNGEIRDKYPKIEHDDIETVDLAQLGTWLKDFSAAGFQLQEEDEMWARKATGMPEVEPEPMLDGSLAGIDPKTGKPAPPAMSVNPKTGKPAPPAMSVNPKTGKPTLAPPDENMDDDEPPKKSKARAA